MTHAPLVSDDVDPEISPDHAAPSLLDVAGAFIGGTFGTLARYAFDRAWPEGDGAVPHTTNVINTTGAFLIGVVATVLANRCPERRALRALLVTGALGGWTTMSAVAVAAARIGSVNGAFTATASSALSFAIGIGATSVGIRLASSRRTETETESEGP
ncbi:MAG TPA: CrcB family protein [Acidimicrobiales bacterium]|nr:CrcB family protein [Acidimicrobiales bacterium]